MLMEAIVFSSDKKYYPYLEVSLCSLIDHLDKEKEYKIFILSEELSYEDIHSLEEYLKKEFSSKTFSLKLKNVKSLCSSDKDSFYTEIHVSASTYLRFYIPTLFSNFDKILYLDCDLIFFSSIDYLLQFDLEDFCLGAVEDLREEIARKIELRVSGRNWKNYLEEELGMADNDKYYQAGVMLFNIKQCLENNFQRECLKRLKQIKRPILADQDIINSVFKRKIKQLPDVWNVEYQIKSDFLNNARVDQSDLIKRFIVARKNVKILHYASSAKPWNNIHDSDSCYWWIAARRARNYEVLLLQQMNESKFHLARIIAKGIVNTFFPRGTKRRTKLKKVLESFSSKIF